MSVSSCIVVEGLQRRFAVGRGACHTTLLVSGRAKVAGGHVSGSKPGLCWWPAVLVQGKAWQFKEFPFRGAAQGDMVDTFSNIFGAFFYYKDDKVGATCTFFACVRTRVRLCVPCSTAALYYIVWFALLILTRALHVG